MVTINNELSEYLPYVDEIIPPDLISEVERLVADELSQTDETYRQTHLHPIVHQILPLTNHRNRPSLLHEIERYEDEDDDEDTNMKDYSTIEVQNSDIIRGGVDLTRYSEFTNPEDDSINYNNMYTTLSYSMIQERNLDLLKHNEKSLSSLQSQVLHDLQSKCEEYNVTINQKRQKIDDINSERKRRQLSDFKPVNDYLNQRWKDGLKSVVDMSIETARIQNNSR